MLYFLYILNQTHMFETFMQYGDFGMFFLRLVIAIIFLYHAMPKLTKAKQMAKMMMGKESMAWFPMLLGVVEVLGALGVLFGYYFAASAFVLSVVMLGAIMMKMSKMKTGFASMSGTGWEFDLMILAGTFLLLTNGGGTMWMFG